MNQDTKFFAAPGFGIRVGFGRRPAVINVDFQNAFTDPSCPVGANADAEVAATVRLIAAARDAEIPIFYTAARFEEPNQHDAGVWGLKQTGFVALQAGTPLVEIDARLGVRAGEHINWKKRASGFFNTDLIARLTYEGVDSVLVTGLTTSGHPRIVFQPYAGPPQTETAQEVGSFVGRIVAERGRGDDRLGPGEARRRTVLRAIAARHGRCLTRDEVRVGVGQAELRCELRAVVGRPQEPHLGSALEHAEVLRDLPCAVVQRGARRRCPAESPRPASRRRRPATDRVSRAGAEGVRSSASSGEANFLPGSNVVVEKIRRLSTQRTTLLSDNSDMERHFHFSLGPLAGLLSVLTPHPRAHAALEPADSDRLFSDAIEREIEQRELHYS
jgi:maleamate amidohydrolase